MIGIFSYRLTIRRLFRLGWPITAFEWVLILVLVLVLVLVDGWCSGTGRITLYMEDTQWKHGKFEFAYPPPSGRMPIYMLTLKEYTKLLLT